MKTIYFKTILVAVLCLMTIPANAQWARFGTYLAMKTMYDYVRTRNEYAPRPIVTPPVPIVTPPKPIVVPPAPIVSGISSLPVDSVIPSIDLNSIRVPKVTVPDVTKFIQYFKGMHYLALGDTISAMTCFDEIKDEVFMARGMLGQLQCLYNGGEKHNEGLLNLLLASVVGDTNSAKFLGNAYLEGIGSFKQDDERALRWFKIGASWGDSICRIKRDMLILSKDSVDSEKDFPF